MSELITYFTLTGTVMDEVRADDIYHGASILRLAGRVIAEVGNYSIFH